MEGEFWLQRWREGKIGFHQDRVTPLLEKHWQSLRLRPDSIVLVPLAGKSLDMDWLLERGHRVIGIELSELAVRQFFAERELEPDLREDRNGIYHRVGDLVLLLGDAFALDNALLASCDAIFDRAALIALPPAMRRHYADRLYARMPSGCECLLITLEYPQNEKAGPPFSVEEAEVRALFARDWRIEALERKDILAEQPGFVSEGVTALATVAYRLQRQ
ncbi:MAG TPA: thiopurine S-methyltransferase [Xanthomonadaceae bacterium]|jgi:thiopurine S-methyltransferase|nr:thiopurine S-methyltransferase [Xanthomonadaceae bacterium]